MEAGFKKAGNFTDEGVYSNQHKSLVKEQWAIMIPYHHMLCG